MKVLSDVLFLSSLIHLIQIFTVTKKQVHLYKKKKVDKCGNFRPELNGCE